MNNLINLYKQTYGKEPYQPLSSLINKLTKCISSTSIPTISAESTTLPQKSKSMASTNSSSEQTNLVT